jgi:hypothetical protein
MGDGAAKGIAQGIATLTAAGLGAAVGGAYGAASAATVDANNRQLHPSEKKLAQELAKRSGGKYTAEQVEEQMRLMGNKAFYDAANKTEVLTTPEAIAQNLEQDPNMPKFSDGKTVVEKPGHECDDQQLKPLPPAAPPPAPPPPTTATTPTPAATPHGRNRR